MGMEEQHNIVIVGGGICGLSTALALHRKGFQILVLEKSNSLRAEGLALGIHSNGWRALDQLGVGNELRMKAIPLMEIVDVRLNKNSMRATSCRNEEYRCLKRCDLIEALAKDLPVNSIRFDSKIVAIEANPITSFPVIHMDNGSKIKAKVLIGCDGSNSVVAKSLILKAPEVFPMLAMQGFTNYPNCHNYESCFFRLMGDQIICGRSPVDDKLVYWYVGCRSASQAQNSEVKRSPQRIKNLILDLLKEFPADTTEMVQQCDLDSLRLGHIWYRSPWSLLSEKLWENTTTVAGDAMHVMSPFLGQGGSAGLEDAIVLARCLARELDIGTDYENIGDRDLKKRVGIALSGYVKERRIRLLRLSTQSYLMGSMRLTSSWVKKMVYFAILLVFFGGTSLGHTKYDCGRL